MMIAFVLLAEEIISWGNLGVIGVFIVVIGFFCIRLINGYDKRDVERQNDIKDLTIKNNILHEDLLKFKIQYYQEKTEMENRWRDAIYPLDKKIGQIADALKK